jgi:Uma2 family endonuclease
LRQSIKKRNFTIMATPIIDTYRWTVKAYHKMAESGILAEDAAVELLYGQIIKMSPIGNLHAACLGMLEEFFRDALGKRVTIRSQNPVMLDEYSEPEPDIAIVKRKDNFYADGHPKPDEVILLVEVADATLEKDRSIKKQAYAENGIPEYWIVNLPDQQLERYIDPVSEDYKQKYVYTFEQTFEHDLLGVITIKDIIPTE